MQRYESYKPTTIEWASEVPSEWEVQPIRALFNERKERNEGPKTDFILSVMKDIGVIPYDEKGNVGNKKSENIENYKVVYPGDLVVNKMNAIIGSLGISRYHGALSQVYFVLYPKDHNRTNHKYLGYLFKVKPFQQSLIKISKGMMELRESIEFDEFKKLVLPVPPLDEQDRIVAFLDQKTAEIDAAISKKERLIELLEENLSIHIARAVTQGLNLNTPLRNSGCSWLGSIPSNWRPMKLTWVCSSIRDGTHNPPPEIDSEYRLLSVRNIVAGEFVIRDDDRTMSLPAFKALTRSYTVQRGDVVLALVGGTTGKSAVVEIDCESISVQRSLGILRPMRSKVLPEFLNFSLKAKGLQRRIWDIATKYAAQPGIYLEDVGNLKIAVPQISEQELIIRYCNDVQDKTFTTIKSVSREIQSLR